jgi:hypothetical protein
MSGNGAKSSSTSILSIISNIRTEPGVGAAPRHPQTKVTSGGVDRGFIDAR